MQILFEDSAPMSKALQYARDKDADSRRCVLRKVALGNEDIAHDALANEGHLQDEALNYNF